MRHRHHVTHPVPARSHCWPAVARPLRRGPTASNPAASRASSARSSAARSRWPRNPDQPAGRTLEVHFAVVPAVARNAREDPVFVLAGGPGQAATRIAGMAMSIFAELNARRDIVFIDQRGTGKSNALDCPDESTSLAATLDPSQQLERVQRCLRELKADTRQYATWIAVRDFDAVRRALGAERINLWGASYGTRAALEYLRQFPQHVRTVVLDGVAPPDMALPAAFAVDADAALTRLVQACQADADCRSALSRLRCAHRRSCCERADAGFDVTRPPPAQWRSRRRCASTGACWPRCCAFRSTFRRWPPCCPLRWPRPAAVTSQRWSRCPPPSARARTRTSRSACTSP